MSCVNALPRLLLRYITVRAVSLLFDYQIKAVGTFLHGVAVNTNIQGTAQEDLQIKLAQMTLNSIFFCIKPFSVLYVITI
jgi:hypothetical protein